MEAGDTVQLMGVQRSVVVPCDDESCSRKHYSDRPEIESTDPEQEYGRYHYEDGPREGLDAIVKGFEPTGLLVTVDEDGVETRTELPGYDPEGRVVLLLGNGTEVSADLDDDVEGAE